MVSEGQCGINKEKWGIHPPLEEAGLKVQLRLLWTPASGGLGREEKSHGGVWTPPSEVGMRPGSVSNTHCVSH